MSLVLAALLVALAIGWSRGGSLERLGALRWRRRWLVVAALLAQLGGALVGGPAYPVGLAAGAGLVLAFLVGNRGTRGTGLVGLGFALNALVVGANGAMPVSLEASARAGVTTQYLLTGEDPRHEVLDEATRLSPLADVVPVPLPRVPQVVSPGDVLVTAGTAQLVVLGMGRRRAPGARPGAGPDAGRDWLRGGVQLLP